MRVVLILALGCLVCALHAQTNTTVFINEESNDPSRNVFIHTNQIIEARAAKTSRPAELDPEGNWGKPVGGLQLSVRLDKNEFTNGEPIMVTTIVRNISWRLVSFRYGEQEIAVRDADGNEVHGKAYRDAPKTRFQESLSKIRRGSGLGNVRPSPNATGAQNHSLYKPRFPTKR